MRQCLLGPPPVPTGDPIRYFVTRTKASKIDQFAVIRRSIGIGFHTFESYYRSYKVYTSCVNRCDSWICHIRLSRKKLHENPLCMISTEVSSLATHNTLLFRESVHFFDLAFKQSLSINTNLKMIMRQHLVINSSSIGLKIKLAVKEDCRVLSEYINFGSKNLLDATSIKLYELRGTQSIRL
jgi:hypothetical protein